MTTDTDEYVKQQTKILTDLSDFENKGVMTKKEYITNLRQVTRPLVLSGYYPDVQLNDLCSFIGDLLEKYNIAYSRTTLPSLFEDDEKRTQFTNKRFLKEEPNISSPLESEQGIIGQLDHLEKSIGKRYDVIPHYAAADKLNTLEQITIKSTNHIKTFTKKLLTANFYVDSFEKQFASAEDAEKILETLPKKQKIRLNSLITIYHSSILLITEMESNLADITDHKIKEMQVTQNITSKEIDERNKLTNWEKMMIILGMDVGGLAKNYCAKLNGIDKKHITNNIYPQVAPTENKTENKHHMYKSWFKCITLKIGGKQHTFDISRWFDEQVERGKLDLEFKPLVVVNGRVE